MWHECNCNKGVATNILLKNSENFIDRIKFLKMSLILFKILHVRQNGIEHYNNIINVVISWAVKTCTCMYQSCIISLVKLYSDTWLWTIVLFSRNSSISVSLKTWFMMNGKRLETQHIHLADPLPQKTGAQFIQPRGWGDFFLWVKWIGYID